MCRTSTCATRARTRASSRSAWDGRIEYARVVTQLERFGYTRSLTVAIIDRLENPFDREVEVRKLKLLLETLL